MQRDNNYREREGAHVAQPGKTAVENNNRESGQTNTGSGESPAEIRAEIAQTRTEMSRTIDAIRDKLDPQHLKDQARDAVREATDHAKGAVREATIGRAEQFLEDAEDTAKGAGYTMMDTIRQNPIPAALVGVGLGWLLVNSRSQSHRQSWSDEGYYATTSYPGARERTRDGNVRRANGSWENHDDSRQSEHLRARAGDLAHRAGDTVGGAAGRTGDAVGDLADRTGNAVGDLAGRAGDVFEGLSERAGETAGNLAGEARYRGGQVQGTFQQQLLNNPMALGAIALGVGAAVGMAAPKTQVEDRFMGETRDHLMEQAQSSIEDVQEKVQDGINQAGNSVQEKAQQNIQQAGQAADSKMQQASDTARQAVQQAGTAAQQTGSAMEQAGTEAKREAQNPSQQKTSSENQRK